MAIAAPKSTAGKVETLLAEATDKSSMGSGQTLTTALDRIRGFSDIQILDGANGYWTHHKDANDVKALGVLFALDSYIYDTSKVPERDLQRFWTYITPPMVWPGGRAKWPWVTDVATGKLVLRGHYTAYIGVTGDPIAELAFLQKHCPRRANEN